MALESPFNQLHTQFKGNMQNYTGWNLPSDYGDITAEQQKLCSNCVAVDLSSFARIELTGSSKDDLLASIASFQAISENQWQFASFQGISDPVRICKLAKTSMVLTTPATRTQVFDLLKTTAAQFSGVKIEDKTEKTAMLGLYGPKALETVKEMLPFDLSGLSPNDVKPVSVFMIKVTVLHGSFLGSDGVEVICGKSTAPMASMAVSKYKDKGTVQPMGMKALTTALASVTIKVNNDDLKYSSGTI